MMETPTAPMAHDLSEIPRWGDAPPPRFADDEMDILAFKLWQKASGVEIAAEQEEEGTEEAAWCHAGRY